MKIWIFQTGEPLHCDGGNPRPMRAMNLANVLVERGHFVEIFSSAFYHQEKRHRSNKLESIYLHERLTIHLIPSIGYKRNIGIGRLFDHAQIAVILWRLLRTSNFTKPDLAFVGYPPIEAAWVMIRWLKKNNVLSIIDVKDQWPSIFIDAVPSALRGVAKLVFAPYFWLGRRAMRDASAITSISEPFLAWALDFAGRPRQEADAVVPLVPARLLLTNTEMSEASQWWSTVGVNLENGRYFSFVGSLSQAFDFSALRDAVMRLQLLHPECQVVICGSGGEDRAVRSLFAGMPNVILPGWIDAPKIAALMQSTVATLAPYRNTSDFQLSIPNKVLDSLSFGQPVVTALRGEVEGLINNAGVGIVCTDTADGWLAALCHLLEDNESRREMSIRAIQIYNDRYDAGTVYGAFVGNMEKLATEPRTP